MKIILHPQKIKKVKFTNEHLDNYKTSTGSTNRGMKKLTNFLRSVSGKIMKNTF